MYLSRSLYGMVSPCSAWFIDTLVYILLLVGRVRKKENPKIKHNLNTSLLVYPPVTQVVEFTKYSVASHGF